MNTTRDAQGKYANKRRRARRVKFFFFFIILLILGNLAYKKIKPFILPTPTDPSATVSILDKHQSEIDKIKERENFKKRIENQAKQVFLSEEIADRNAKIDALKAEISNFEKDLELTRKEELSLQ